MQEKVMHDERRHQEWTDPRQAEKVKRRERAAKCLDCQYTVLADTEQLKAWRCKAPALPAMPSTSRSPRFGIAIVGGTNGLTFDVGYYI
jgi:hypothetical protein